MKKEDQFNILLLKVMDEQMKNIFGETGAQIIYNHLSSNYSLKREEIPENFEVFVRNLHDYLGSGAYVIENAVLKSLYQHFGQKFRSKGSRGLIDHINRLKDSSLKESIYGRRRI